MASDDFTRDNIRVRTWYLEKLRDISQNISRDKSLREQAESAHELRNFYKAKARYMMEDKREAERLKAEEPLRYFGDFIEKYAYDEGCRCIDDVYRKILDKSSVSRREVNTGLGLEVRP